LKKNTKEEENNFKNFQAIDYNKRKVGRPFKGTVEESTKEPHVPERRSVLRAFKKFYAKKEFIKSGKQENEFMHRLLDGFSPLNQSWINHYVSVCKQTQSADHYRKKPHELYINEGNDQNINYVNERLISQNFEMPTQYPPSLLG